jgi:hypothetical protein
MMLCSLQTALVNLKQPFRQPVGEAIMINNQMSRHKGLRHVEATALLSVVNVATFAVIAAVAPGSSSSSSSSSRQQQCRLVHMPHVPQAAAAAVDHWLWDHSNNMPGHVADIYAHCLTLPAHLTKIPPSVPQTNTRLAAGGLNAASAPFIAFNLRPPGAGAQNLALHSGSTHCARPPRTASSERLPVFCLGMHARCLQRLSLLRL